MRRDEEDNLIAPARGGLILEKLPQNRDIAQERQLRDRFRGGIPEQAAEHDRRVGAALVYFLAAHIRNDA